LSATPPAPSAGSSDESVTPIPSDAEEDDYALAASIEESVLSAQGEDEFELDLSSADEADQRMHSERRISQPSALRRMDALQRKKQAATSKPRKPRASTAAPRGRPPRGLTHAEYSAAAAASAAAEGVRLARAPYVNPLEFGVAPSAASAFEDARRVDQAMLDKLQATLAAGMISDEDD
jgi:hypothetical protein